MPAVASIADKFAAVEPVAGNGPGFDDLGIALAIVWFSGVLLLAVSLLWRFGAVLRLRYQARPIHDSDWRRAFERARRDLGMRRSIALLSHEAVVSPMAWGPPADTQDRDANGRPLQLHTFIRCSSGPKRGR